MKKHKAFSLIELSIVILVVGLIIAGVTQSSRLIYKSRLSTARALTNSSPVPGIKNLVFWIETTSTESFNDSDLSSNSLEINEWHNINPTVKHAQGLEQSIGSIPVPTYQENGIAGLPSVFFNAAADGNTGNSLKTVGNEPTQGSNEFTIFMVAEPREVTASNALPIYAISPVQGYQLKKTTDPEWVAWSGNGSTWNSTTKTAIHNDPVIISFYYEDGTHYLSQNADTPTTKTASYSPNATIPLYLGGWSGGFFDGLISEVIIYNRGLRQKERKSVESYLSQKYKIALNG